MYLHDYQILQNSVTYSRSTLDQKIGFILGYFEIPISASQIFKEGKKLLQLESGFDIKETFTEENQSGRKSSRQALREKPISKSIIEETCLAHFDVCISRIKLKTGRRKPHFLSYIECYFQKALSLQFPCLFKRYLFLNGWKLQKSWLEGLLNQFFGGKKKVLYLLSFAFDQLFNGSTLVLLHQRPLFLLPFA